MHGRNGKVVLPHLIGQPVNLRGEGKEGGREGGREGRKGRREGGREGRQKGNQRLVTRRWEGQSGGGVNIVEPKAQSGKRTT